MGSRDVELVLSVNFLYFLAAGLVTPVFASHVMANGGNHVIIGTMVAGNFLCGKYSKKFVERFDHFKKLPIVFILHCSLISYFILAFSKSWLIICMNKWLFTLTNQVTQHSKLFLSTKNQDDAKTKFSNFIDIIRVTAMALGVILGGHIFAWTEEFAYLAMLSTLLSAIAIILLQYVDGDTDNQLRESHDQLPIIPQCYQQLQILKEANYRTKWDSVLLKVVFTFAFSSFFSRFPLLLRSSYGVGHIIVSFAVAYQLMVTFACDAVVPLIKPYVSTNEKKLFENCLVISGVCLTGLYYAPTYECYLIMFVPVIVSHILITSLMKDDDNFKVKSEGGPPVATDVLYNVTNVFGPVLFGSMAQIFGGHAFKIFTLLPIAVGVYLVNQRYLHKSSDVGKEEDKTKED